MMTYLIYSDELRLFWHNGTDSENEGFGGWGHPATASCYSIYEACDYEYIAGPNSRWVRRDSSVVTEWHDPDE